MPCSPDEITDFFCGLFDFSLVDEISLRLGDGKFMEVGLLVRHGSEAQL